MLGAERAPDDLPRPGRTRRARKSREGVNGSTADALVYRRAGDGRAAVLWLGLEEHFDRVVAAAEAALRG